MPETRRASSLLSDKRKELTCIILWVQQINLMRTKTKSHPKPKRVLLKESTRQNFPFIYFVRSPNRRNAKYFLACLSRKFIISWLSLWPQSVLWIISAQGFKKWNLYIGIILNSASKQNYSYISVWSAFHYFVLRTMMKTAKMTTLRHLRTNLNGKLYEITLSRDLNERLFAAPITLKTFQQVNENKLKRM